ncbi:MAG: hypothetical protein JJV90_01575, partial [Spiroplasma sp.]|nr:hypothetical protein [Mycoplasmatales bacterium]
NQDVLSTDSWLDLFAYLDYDVKRVNDNIIAEFQVYLTTHDNAEELVKEYFFKSHQFYNETYSNHYNVVEEQLQTISDALRANLQLKQEPVTMPNLAYGNNRANGLIPKQERVETDNDEVIVEDNDDDIIEDDPTITDPDEIIDDEDAIDDEIDEEFPIDPDGPNDPDNPDDDTENPDPENPDDGIETPDPDDPDDGIETPDPDVDPENPTDPAAP